MFENVNGIAVGLGPLAHIAMYKVCSNFSCPDNAILVTTNAVIDNGVDVLSLFICEPFLTFYDNSITIDALIFS